MAGPQNSPAAASGGDQPSPVPLQPRPVTARHLLQWHSWDAQMREQLESGDTEVREHAVQRAIWYLCQPTRVLVELTSDIDPPAIYATRSMTVIELRTGDALANYAPADILSVEDLELAGVEREAVGHMREARIHPFRVSAVMDAISAHNIWFEFTHRPDVAAAMSQRYRIEWVEGYPPTDPQVHDLGWFNHRRGFDTATVEALVTLQVGETHRSEGVTEAVAITRVA